MIDNKRTSAPWITFASEVRIYQNSLKLIQNVNLSETQKEAATARLLAHRANGDLKINPWMTNACKNRMRDHIVERLSYYRESLLITLTHGDQFPPPGESYRIFHNWLRAAYRDSRLPDLRCHWVKEFQTRGALHYHLVMTWNTETTALEEGAIWLHRRWLEATGNEGSTPRARERYGCYIEPVYEAEGAAIYLVGELGKQAQKRAPAGVTDHGKWHGRRGWAGNETLDEGEPGELTSEMEYRARDLCQVMFPEWAGLVKENSRGETERVNFIRNFWIGPLARFIQHGRPADRQNSLAVIQRGRAKRERDEALIAAETKAERDAWAKKFNSNQHPWQLGRPVKSVD